MQTEYNPDFFVPTDLEHAKNIILTPEDSEVDCRWEKETEWVFKIIDASMQMDSKSVVLDWGCGIGRVSKMLIDRYQCKVVGVDLQPKMLEYAKDYVNSDLFSTKNYSEIYSNFFRDEFTHVFSCWVFQHSDKIQYEIPLIYESMRYDSKMFVLELDKKAIPNKNGGFYDDGITTRSVLEKFFSPEIIGKMPIKYTTKKIRDMSWWAILNKDL
jgi:cyclopropane fatty-acyl-phospholipid synthase-like methyltransferase